MIRHIFSCARNEPPVREPRADAGDVAASSGVGSGTPSFVRVGSCRIPLTDPNTQRVLQDFNRAVEEADSAIAQLSPTPGSGVWDQGDTKSGPPLPSGPHNGGRPSSLPDRPAPNLRVIPGGHGG